LHIFAEKQTEVGRQIANPQFWDVPVRKFLRNTAHLLPARQPQIKDYKNVIESYQKTKYEAAHVFTNMAYDTKTVLCHFILAG
jgi:hypothetical protein